MMSDLQRSLLDFRRELYRPTPKQTVVEWCEANLELTQRQTESPGPFRTANRPYMREPLENWKDSNVRETVLCWGSQTAKTTTIMAGLAWLIGNQPSPCLWLMPNADLARSFSKGRWMPMLEDCPALVAKFPADRDKLTNLEQQFKDCTLTFIGSNSPANLASRPVRTLIADEVDKFAEATAKEADALDLAEQRLKAFSSSIAFLTSTPTTSEGRIWQRFLRGDQRRFFVPCPHCHKPIKLLWEQVRWTDPATGATAKDEDGKWDFRKVMAWARYECQLCKGSITDSHKVAALRHGEWRAENPNAMPGVRSYHLSSLYSPDRSCTWGRLAAKFIEEQESILGLQGFINGMLAEPWENQSAPKTREEVVVGDDVERKADVVRFLCVDYQAAAPFFWFAVREFDQEGNSLGIDAGHLDTWQDVRDKQLEHAVKDHHVLIDSGFEATTVYAECLRWGKLVPRIGKVPMWVGWMPAKGESRTGWRDPKTNLEVPTFLRALDPKVGSVMQGKLQLNLLEFATDTVKDILERLSKGKVATRHEVMVRVATPEYWHHRDCERKVAEYSARTGRTTWTWKPRSKRWPNHMNDCEVMAIAAAIFHGRLKIRPNEERP